ncbi:MAG TPA: helix-turn-helix transcriptional regulator [Thermoanaerobaculia bacterium]
MKEKSTRIGELFGERLREPRQRKDVTQVVLAERSGLPTESYQCDETGSMLPTLVTLIRIAAALRCKVSEPDICLR